MAVVPCRGLPQLQYKIVIIIEFTRSIQTFPVVRKWSFRESLFWEKPAIILQPTGDIASVTSGQDYYIVLFSMAVLELHSCGSNAFDVGKNLMSPVRIFSTVPTSRPGVLPVLLLSSNGPFSTCNIQGIGNFQWSDNSFQYLTVKEKYITSCAHW